MTKAKRTSGNTLLFGKLTSIPRLGVWKKKTMLYFLKMILSSLYGNIQRKRNNKNVYKGNRIKDKQER